MFISRISGVDLDKPTEATIKLGEFVKEKAEQKGLTKKQIASELEFFEETIDRFYHGEILLSYDKLKSICEMVGITVDDAMKYLK